jgi:hypothetical protein
MLAQLDRALVYGKELSVCRVAEESEANFQ